MKWGIKKIAINHVIIHAMMSKMLIAMKPGRLLFCTLYKYKSFVKIVAKVLILGLCRKEKSKTKGKNQEILSDNFYHYFIT